MSSAVRSSRNRQLQLFLQVKWKAFLIFTGYLINLDEIDLTKGLLDLLWPKRSFKKTRLLANPSFVTFGDALN